MARKHRILPTLSQQEKTRFWSRVQVVTQDECWTWLGYRSPEKYGGFDYHGMSNVGAHRVSYLIEHGTDPGEMEVLHRCDNPPCVNPRHLFLGTQRENIRDMYAKGRNAAPWNKGVKGFKTGLDHWMRKKPDRIARGERHGSRTHPEALLRGAAHPSACPIETVDRIRRMLSDGETQVGIAAKVGVSAGTVWRIEHGKGRFASSD